MLIVIYFVTALTFPKDTILVIKVVWRYYISIISILFKNFNFFQSKFKLVNLPDRNYNLLLEKLYLIDLLSYRFKTSFPFLFGDKFIPPNWNKFLSVVYLFTCLFNFCFIFTIFRIHPMQYPNKKVSIVQIHLLTN